MNEAYWKKEFVEWIACYDSIGVLSDLCIMDDEEALTYKAKLLEDIVVTVRSEME